MPKKMRGLGSKGIQLTVRVMPRIKEIVAQVALGEGMDFSEWLRNLIVGDLKSRGALPTALTVPGLSEEERVERKDFNGHS
jgi:hypothetical protein